MDNKRKNTGKSTCRHQRKCSGCPVIHLPYDEQLALKTAVVAKHTKKHLRKSPADDLVELRPIVKSQNALGYRTSVKLCLSRNLKGRQSVGLYRHGSKQVIDIPGCPVHDGQINSALKSLFYSNRPLPALMYNHDRGFQEDRIKYLTLRVCPKSGDLALIISHTGVERRNLRQWVKSLDLARVCVYESLITPADRDLVIGTHTQYLAGAAHLRYIVAGHEFELPPTAFFQANYGLAEQFIEEIVGFSNAGKLEMPSRQLIDLYGGFGAYSLALQKGFSKIYLVDGNDSAIAAADNAIRKYNYSNIVPYTLSVESFLSENLSPEASLAITDAIANPPRTGLSTKVLHHLCDKKFKNLKRMTYVSCNPTTLDRDLEVLIKRGRFHLQSVTPFDMFPQTEHVEVVAHLQRN